MLRAAERAYIRPVGIRRHLWGRGRWFALTAVVVAAVMVAGPAAGAPGKPRHMLRVMTRNLYLGADLTMGLQATSLSKLNDAAGQIWKQVRQNDFRIRARGLAHEILATRPDLIGLQEAALWRTSPACKYFLHGPYTAKHVVYDYVKLLLGQLNRGRRRYTLVGSQPEFDFQTEANTNGGAPGSCSQDIRLTMRDAILARVGAGVRWRHVRRGHFRTLLAPRLAGLVSIPVTRGWISADVKVRGSRWFRFVDTHLESFDAGAANRTSQGKLVGNGQIREAQARELIHRGGPASGRLPVVLVGDLNSDVRTPLKPGDGLADRALLKAGFRERSTYRPLSCCLETSLLSYPSGGGRVGDFNHKVDHVMTDDPRQIRLVSSKVTGRHPVDGFWDSDHAGTFSVVTLP